MKSPIRAAALSAVAFTAISCAAYAGSESSVTSPEIHIEDVERFYKVYDAANGRRRSRATLGTGSVIAS